MSDVLQAQRKTVKRLSGILETVLINLIRAKLYPSLEKETLSISVIAHIAQLNY